MRLGAFLQYSEYTVSRHQGWGGPLVVSTPASRKIRLSQGLCLSKSLTPPCPASPRSVALPYHQDDLGSGHLQEPPVTGGTHTHTPCPLAALSAHHVQRPPVIVPHHLKIPQFCTHTRARM